MKYPANWSWPTKRTRYRKFIPAIIIYTPVSLSETLQLQDRGFICLVTASGGTRDACFIDGKNRGGGLGRAREAKRRTRGDAGTEGCTLCSLREVYQSRNLIEQAMYSEYQVATI